MRKLLLILVLFSGFSVSAQKILMEENVDADTIPSSYGPNLKHFMHSFVNYGIIIGQVEGDSAFVDYGKSFDFASGIRYKYKFSETLALVVDLAYNMQGYRFKQVANKRFPSSTIYDKEKLTFTNISLAPALRFNFGKRGNVIGKFVDVGGYFDWTIMTKYLARIDNSNDPTANSKYTEITNKKLDYANKFNYGTTIRAGWDWFAVYAKYRLSDYFVSSYGYPELPRIIIGIELSATGD